MPKLQTLVNSHFWSFDCVTYLLTHAVVWQTSQVSVGHLDGRIIRFNGISVENVLTRITFYKRVVLKNMRLENKLEKLKYCCTGRVRTTECQAQRNTYEITYISQQIQRRILLKKRKTKNVSFMPSPFHRITR